MKIRQYYLLVITGLTLLFVATGCGKKEYDKSIIAKADNYHSAVKKLTDVIVYDIFSPPVASRIYAYPSIAAYETLINAHPGYVSLSGQLRDLAATPKPDENKTYDFSLASIHAFLVVGKALIFSEEKIADYESNFLARLKKESGMSEQMFKNSIAYGDQVAQHILDWADKDNYKQTRTFPKYSIQYEDHFWKPTPPDYMEGIEPHWNKIRPFVLDSAEQFTPPFPTEFDLDPSSTFYKELLEVYEVGKNLDAEQEEIAKFWDCNPYVSTHSGHTMFATKKITPGGHWIGITSIACKQANISLMETVAAYTKVSVAMADAFISCWDEKWRSVLVRPETLINELIDQDWTPLLQTPPFPEYTSGHSVVSGAASMTLTDIFGDNFAFIDTTEMEYNLPARSFTSFINAAEEAAISRLYGGIHYMPAIDNGLDQGTSLGKFINARLNFKN
ncbi:vanadium-dependent haloperoxidase [Fulvivirgaceae bacterium BMA10]|uniref:Vanadium-dependent haloperoxidase n=1 Tax=Splendidivirga corallicola TaxID=3051826 RepID=A0ABT8KHX2_9BACT|nr:vanadium-dependent haloperoxidase [Fulvivirgaceae bacterium BMA10]